MSSLADRFRTVIAKFLQGEAVAMEQGVDDYPMLLDDPLIEAQRQLDALIRELLDWQKQPGNEWGDIDQALKTLPGARAILDSPREQQPPVVQAAMLRRIFLNQRHNREHRRWKQHHYRLWSLSTQSCDTMISALMRRQQPFNREDILAMLTLFSEQGEHLSYFPMGQFFKQLERFVQQQGLDDSLNSALKTWQDSRYMDRQSRQRIEAMLDPGDANEPDAGVDPGDAWGEQVVGFLDGLGAGERRDWAGLLQLCGQTESASKATSKFRKAAGAFIDTIGRERYGQVLGDWLRIAQQCQVQQGTDPYLGYFNAWLLMRPNETRLRALIWTTSQLGDDSHREPLAGLAEHCFTKIPGIGPVAVRLGNACLNALAALGLGGVATLTVLRQRIKHANSRKLLEKLIQEAAQQAGLSPGEIEDLAVPDHGLVDGELRQQLGEHQALLQVGADLKPTLAWAAASGKIQKSVPAAVKRDHADALKALKATTKTLQTLLGAQRQRLERFYLERRQLTLKPWRERFVDHGLMGCLTRRLIWRIGEDQDVLWIDDAWRDAAGNALATLPNDTPVRLWHPLDSSVAGIAQWRALLQQHQIRQPFKQAFREVYILTEAERETGSYSNRFAAHLIKQHQFNALRQGRGWRYALQGAWDGGESTPELILPAWQLRAEFWVEAADINRIADSGIFLYLSTDQVRFYPMDQPTTPLPLENVPALAFSEVLRDVDLFVGVCSVGNDPTWRDQGDNPRWVDAWNHFAFGELSATAETRREVLATLLPKLKIRDRCQLQGRFLRVQGKLRNYKIHLGSSNILMEPNDQYLCIVPDRRGSSNKVFLPFEDDTTLSLVLSKAFLLADDDKIDDPSIVSQIRFRG